MGYRLTQFDGLVLPIWMQSGDEQNMGRREARSSVLTLPDGYLDTYGANDSPIAPSTISRRGVVTAATVAGVTALLDALRAKVGKSGELTVQMSDDSLRWVTARLQVADLPRPLDAKGGWLPFEMVWQQVGPVWNGVENDADGWTWGDGSWTFGDGTAAFGTGTEVALTATGGSGGTTQAVSITNAGNVNRAGYQVTVTAGTNEITIVNWANATSGFSWTWTGSLTTGQVLVVDTDGMNVTKQGANAYNGFVPSHKRTWDRLVPGANAITVTVTGNAAGGTDGRISWAYKDAWA